MEGELVTTTTSDHVRLHGLYRRSNERLLSTPETGSPDAAVLVHGLGGNFYSSRLLLHVAQTLCGIGVSVVIVNTRGHDMINTTAWAGKSKSAGAALEDVADAKFDVPAWVEFLVKKGHSNVLVLGHSLGAIKSLYAQAFNPHPKIKSIICLSATRLSHSKLIDAPQGENFRQTFTRCERLVGDGQGETPVQVTFPYPTWMTPQCYVDKYGPAESFNWLSFIDRVDVPTLLLFGQKELDNDLAFVGIRPQLEELNQAWNSFTIGEVPEADHFYTAKFSDVDEQLVRWLT
jgi:pimeloyl-ACP methyl ester carboxylesterase